MIKVEDLKKLVKLVLLTGYIKNEKPLSLFFVAVAGSGKTSITMHYKSKRVLFATDLTYRGLLDELEQNKAIKHVIIPDFIKITQKRRSTSDNLISLLNALVEEGVGKISMYNYNKDFQGRTAGLIMSTTKASFNQNKKSWTSFGFLSRMLICTYSYDQNTIQEILDFINEEAYNQEKEHENLKGYRQRIVTSEKELNSQLNELSKRNFRKLKQLQTLAKAHAILRGSNKVTQQDIDEVKRLAKFLNLNYNKI